MNFIVSVCSLPPIVALAADPRSPEEEDKPPSFALRIWDAVTQRLANIWRWKRKGRTTASRAGDVEMALRNQSEAESSETESSDADSIET